MNKLPRADITMAADVGNFFTGNYNFATAATAHVKGGSDRIKTWDIFSEYRTPQFHDQLMFIRIGVIIRFVVTTSVIRRPRYTG